MRSHSKQPKKTILVYITYKMGGFACEKCGAIFSRRRNLEYHINNNVCKEKQYSCKHCDKKFSTRSTMYRHIKDNCKTVKAKDKENGEIYEKLLKMEETAEKRDKIKNKIIEKQSKELEKQSKEIETLKKEMEKLSSNKAANVNNGNINNGEIVNGNITNNNITLIAYGHEDFSKLTKEEMLKILQTGYNSTIKLTEAIHFDPKRPENHNVYISNKKDKYAMIFDGTEWNLRFKDDVVNMLYDDKKNYIEENMLEFYDSLSQSRKNALARWLNTDENDERIKRIKNEIKFLIYNKKNLPIETLKLNPLNQKIKTIKYSKTKKSKDEKSQNNVVKIVAKKLKVK